MSDPHYRCCRSTPSILTIVLLAFSERARYAHLGTNVEGVEVGGTTCGLESDCRADQIETIYLVVLYYSRQTRYLDSVLIIKPNIATIMATLATQSYTPPATLCICLVEMLRHAPSGG